MRVKFFGGPWHRKKMHLPDPLPHTWKCLSYTNPLYNLSDAGLTPATREETYYRNDVKSEGGTFTVYVHESTSIDDVLRKALT